MNIVIRDVPGGAEARWLTADGRTVARSVGYVPPVEVSGRLGRRLGALARRAARSRALRGIARAARGVARATPYGRAALEAIDVARRAARAARGRPSGVRLATSRGARRATRGDVALSDAQRVEVARMILSSRIPPAARARLALEVLS